MIVNEKLKKHAWTILKIGLSILGFWFAFSTIDIQTFKAALSNASYSYLIVGLIFYVFSQVISSYRLQLVIKCLPQKLPFLWNLRLYFQGMAYNLFLPGGIGGDAYKTIAFSKKSNGIHKAKKYIAPLLGDRLIGLVGIVVVLSLVVFSTEYNGSYHWVKTALITLTPIGVVLGYWLVRRFYNRYQKAYFPTLGLSIVVQFLQLVAVYLITVALGINSLSLIPVMATVFLVSTIATAIPVFLGGLGAREIVFAGMFPILGYDSEVGVLISILFSLIVVVSSAPGLGLGLIKD